MLLRRADGNIIAIAEKLQVVRARQDRHKFLISIRLRPAQLVIEMDDRENNSQLAPQLQQKPQQRHRINPTRNRHTYAVPSPQQFLPPDVRKHALSQWVHGNNGSARVMWRQLPKPAPERPEAGWEVERGFPSS